MSSSSPTTTRTLFQSTPPVAQGRSAGNIRATKRLAGFQSTPPVAQGRSMELAEEHGLKKAVSIHAPGCPGAKLGDGGDGQPGFKFQSTPPVAQGRSRRSDAFMLSPYRFQSTPPVAQGRSFAPGRKALRELRVSIHAPGCPGAKPGSLPCGSQSVAVSIHAPGCPGAKQWHRLMSAPDGLFQSTPPVAQGRSPR